MVLDCQFDSLAEENKSYNIFELQSLDEVPPAWPGPARWDIDDDGGGSGRKGPQAGDRRGRGRGSRRVRVSAGAKQKRWISNLPLSRPQDGWRMDPCGYTVSGKFKVAPASAAD
jgi:hypothetical protein